MNSNPILSGLLALTTFCLHSSGLFAQSAANEDHAAADEASKITFIDLQRTDGKKSSLSDYKQDCVVVCFTSNTCPYSVDYEERIKDLQIGFQKNQWSAVVVAINSNDHKDDTLEEMTKRAKEQKYNFDYLKDSEQEAAKIFDAVYTPEFFVLNKQRRIVYQGALDDSTNSADVMVNYVTQAIEALRAGRSPEIIKTGARGCRIRFQRRKRKP